MCLIAGNIVDAFYKHIGLYLFFSVVVIAWMLFESVANRSKTKTGNSAQNDLKDCGSSQKEVSVKKRNDDKSSAIKQFHIGKLKRIHFGWLLAVIVAAISILIGYFNRFEFTVENGVAYRMNRWTGKIERLPRNEIVHRKNQYRPTTEEKKVLDRLFENCDGDLEQLTGVEAEIVARYYARRLRVEKGSSYDIELPQEQLPNKQVGAMSDAELKAELARIEIKKDWWRMQAYLIWSTEFKKENEPRIRKPNVFGKTSQAR